MNLRFGRFLPFLAFLWLMSMLLAVIYMDPMHQENQSGLHEELAETQRKAKKLGDEKARLERSNFQLTEEKKQMQQELHQEQAVRFQDRE
jgi:hypothetical protein